MNLVVDVFTAIIAFVVSCGCFLWRNVKCDIMCLFDVSMCVKDVGFSVYC